MLHWIDRLASRWLGWRTDRHVKQLQKENPEAFGKFLKAEASPERTVVTAQAPHLVMLASEAAALLNAYNAKNYVEIDMFPRLDHGMRPVRLTVQWAIGAESPAQKAARLEKEVERLQLELQARITNSQ